MNPEIIRANEQLPAIVINSLSTRVRNKINELQLFTPAQIAALTLEQIVGIRGFGAKAVAEFVQLRGRCLDGSVWNASLDFAQKCALNPMCFVSFDDYVEAVFRAAGYNLKDKDLGILKLYNGYLSGVQECYTLEATGKEYGLTRERVRQISDKFDGIFETIYRSLFDDLVGKVEKILDENKHFVTKEELEKRLSSEFDWQSVDANAVIRIVSRMGTEIRGNNSGFYTKIDGAFKARYNAILERFIASNGIADTIKFQAIKESAQGTILEGITEEEYKFLCHEVVEEVDRIAPGVKGYKGTSWIEAIKVELGIKTPKNQCRNSILKYELEKAGRIGLSTNELFEACNKSNEFVNWDMPIYQRVRQEVFERGEIIQYTRAEKENRYTMYTLTKFLLGDNGNENAARITAKIAA